jgi:hypothetical protein
VGILYSADFTGTDTDPIGGNYTTITGLTNCQRLSNTLAGSTSGDCGVYVNSITTPADAYCECTVPAGNSPPDEGGSIVRVDQTNNNFYLAMWIGNGGGSEIHLYKWTAGTKSLLQATAFTPSGDFKLRVSAQGSNIKAYADGVLKCSAVDATFTSGNAGFFITRGADPTIFFARTIEIGTVPPPPPFIASGTGRPWPFAPGNAR